jgi:hypothetical protein
MKVPPKIAEWWPLALLIGLLTAIGWFGSQIAHAAAEPFWTHIAPAIPQTLVMSLCCILLLAIILLAFWVIYLHRVHRQPTEAEKSREFHDQFGDFVPARVNATKLKALPIALPLLDEQGRIVAELDVLQAEVDELKRLQAETATELDALLPSILDKAFKGEL